MTIGKRSSQSRSTRPRGRSWILPDLFELPDLTEHQPAGLETARHARGGGKNREDQANSPLPASLSPAWKGSSAATANASRITTARCSRRPKEAPSAAPRTPLSPEEIASRTKAVQLELRRKQLETRRALRDGRPTLKPLVLLRVNMPATAVRVFSPSQAGPAGADSVLEPAFERPRAHRLRPLRRKLVFLHIHQRRRAGALLALLRQVAEGSRAGRSFSR